MTDFAAPHALPSRCGPNPLLLQLATMMLRAGGDSDRLRAALAGVEAWRAHPFRRPPSSAETVWREGSSRLLDFGGGGPSALLVPSLVNPADILDLLPDNSVALRLKARGLRPLLLDWGAPGAAERGHGVGDYMRRLQGLLALLKDQTGAPLPVVGYCMGGTLAAAVALDKPDLVGRLALLAAPWDFHAGDSLPRRLAQMALPIMPMIEALGAAPVDLIQSFFASLNPGAALDKFARFAAMDQRGPEAELFVALEDWVNGGPPLSGPLAIEVLKDWYALNLPGAGLWSPFGERLSPGSLAMPVFAAVPARDRIVPPQGALGLLPALAADCLIRPKSGHVGMVIGRRAAAELIDPMADWLRTGL